MAASPADFVETSAAPDDSAPVPAQSRQAMHIFLLSVSHVHLLFLFLAKGVNCSLEACRLVQQMVILFSHNLRTHITYHRDT